MGGFRNGLTAARVLAAALATLLAALALPGSAAAAIGKSPAAAELERMKQLCETRGLEVVEKATSQCTHGEDPPPPGRDISKDVKPVPTLPAAEAGAVGSAGEDLGAAAPLFSCDGDGSTGYRTQVMYVHASDTLNRHNLYKASILQWAWEADQIYRTSAQDTGGLRRIRFVHDAGCTPTVLDVTLSPSGDDSFGNTISQLQQAGYYRTDRKYLIFMDANVVCGVGTMSGDDRPGQENWNNTGPDFARVDSGCWSGDIAAHEHMHNLGGVQDSAPHSSRGGHCTDEWDVMCYSDEPHHPAMQINCATTSRNWSRFDCNYDDYFNTNPLAGSYLATHWNTANNRFLEGATGSPPTVACPDEASEPDTSFAAAAPLEIGIAAPRALCATGDQDWISFQAVANQNYRVEVPSHASSITPVVEVLAANGKRTVAEHRPAAGGLASVDFRARTGGVHYVKLTNLTESYDPSVWNVYQIRVSNLPATGGEVGGFGYNAYNQVGGGGPQVRGVPAVTVPLDAVQVSAGHLHSAAVLTDGSVRTWGWNEYGQLGDGTKTNRPEPVQPAGLSGVAAVSAGMFHTLALKADGTVWSWGHNSVGTVGDGTTSDRLAPVKVPGLSDIVEVSAGWLHSLALKRDGTVWAWGFNAFSSLGDGTTANRTSPVKLALGSVTGVSAGGYHSLAVLKDGTVKGWGYNYQGQVGDRTRTLRATPATVVGLGNVYRVSAGFVHSLALGNNGAVSAWGHNAFQESGGAPAPDRLVPAVVACGSDASCPKLPGTAMLGQIAWISAGTGMHNAAMADDGTVWTWGWNAAGQLGNGGAANSGVAVKAPGVVAGDVSANFYHNLFRT
jgi:alpha-tubulin suppressor-like RCC1 family protein